jgi:hypothetical protein
MLDLAMIALLLAAFVGAALYVRICRGIGTAWQPPGNKTP